MKQDENECYVELVAKAKVGQPVIEDDDGTEYHGVITEVQLSNGSSPTHCGNFYICVFAQNNEDEDGMGLSSWGETFPGHFDSWDLGRTVRFHDTLHPKLVKHAK